MTLSPNTWDPHLTLCVAQVVERYGARVGPGGDAPRVGAVRHLREAANGGEHFDEAASPAQVSGVYAVQDDVHHLGRGVALIPQFHSVDSEQRSVSSQNP